MLARLLRTNLRPYRKWLAIAVVLQGIAAIAALTLPSLNADIIDQGVTQGDTAFIVRTGAVMLAIALAQITATVIAIYFASKTSMGFGRDLRAQLFHQVGTFSTRELNRYGAPSLITRATNDVTQIQTLVHFGSTMMVTAPIMMVGGILMAIREDAGLARVLLVTIPLLGITISLIVSQMIPGFRVMQDKIDAVNRILREQITGIRVVRAFVREPHEAQRFGVANDELTQVSLTTGRWMASMLPTVFLVLNLSLIGVLWFGGVRVDAGQMQIGAITAFITYLMQILMSVMMATFTLVMVPRASVSASRIGEVLDTETSVPPPSQPVPITSPRGLIAIDGVGFAYPGAEAPVLQDVSFEATPGTTTAIVGSTGSGKTTLTHLLPRLYDPTQGAIRFDGIDVRHLEPEALWANIGLVPQRAYLFTGTIADNLRIGNPNATEAEMWEALKIAQADTFVASLPDALEAPVAQGGTNFSGGQRQRLAIARAVIRKPRVYIFDDAFSALDVATDARLRQALRKETRESTVIIVAQRVSTIRNADQIVVIDDGRVVGVGDHDHLLNTCTTYQEIVSSQASIEEVA